MEKNKSLKNENLKSHIRSCLFFLIFSNSLFLAMKIRGSGYIHNFSEYMIVQLGLIVVLTITEVVGKSTEKEIVSKSKTIDRMALASCTTLAVYTFVSDILVDKTFRFSGTGIFVVLFFFGYAYNKGDKEKLVRDYERAVQWFLLFLIIITLLVKDLKDDGRFSGPIDNPSVYALYLGGIWAVLFGSLENKLLFRENNRKIIFNIIEILVTLFLALASQSMTPLIAMLAIMILLFFRIAVNNKGISFATKMLIIIAVVSITALTGVLILIRHTDIAASIRLFEKIQAANLSSLLSGRDYYWRVYLRKMNLFGHGEKPFLWGMKINPHNAVIGMAYMYGVPCVIPYILMFMMAIEKSYRYANRYTPYAAVPLYSIVTFVIMGIADNVEQPLIWLPTISCYILMAPILLMPIEELNTVEYADKKRSTNGSEVLE